MCLAARHTRSSATMFIAALLGFTLGWLGSIPVAGPISALVLTRGIQGRFRAGVFISLGAGLVEAAYAYLAFWGFSTFLSDYPIIEPISRATAALVLAALGITFIRGKATETKTEEAPRDSALGSFTLGATLCLLNPTLIATWGATVTTLYSTKIIDFSSSQAVPFALGSCLGIAGWFLTLLWLIHRYKDRFTTATLGRTIRSVGWLLLIAAAWFAVEFVQGVMA